MSFTDALVPLVYLSRTLTIAIKGKYFERIKERDDGFVCFYCNCNLSIGQFVYEHLNNDRSDNRIENIVFACQSCNNKKPHDESMKKKALEKLADNENNVLCERKFEKRETTPEMNTNEIGLQMAEEYLEEKLEENEYVDYSDTISSITYRIYKKLGHSSEVTVARHIKTLCCSEAQYEIVKEDKERKITKKKGILGGRGEVKRVAKRKEKIIPVNVLHYMLINNKQASQYQKVLHQYGSKSRTDLSTDRTISHIIHMLTETENNPEGIVNG